MSTRLSPLNFSSLIARAAMPANEKLKQPQHVWTCPECGDTHDRETDALYCCQKEGSEPCAEACPVCGHDGVADHYAAVDCCLWKDLDAPTRWRIASQVEAGRPWVEDILAATNH